ncbi:MAG: multi-sensor signal transduction histidine kinase [Firmicutes bacterium]|nr:multi-sensor signal transduction histidine kinase [Bacillota bacterium]
MIFLEYIRQEAIMFKWGIKLRLTISYLLLILFTMPALSGYLLWYFYQHNLEILTSSLLTHAHVTEHFLENYMAGPNEKSQIDQRIKELATKTDLRVTVLWRPLTLDLIRLSPHFLLPFY